MASILNTTSGTLGGSGFGARDRDDLIDKIDDNFELVNEFAGKVTGSLSVMFAPSGSAAMLLGVNGGVVGSAYTPIDAVITNIAAWAATSGSGGVTRVNVQVQQGPAGNFSTLFAHQTYRPALSSSLGDYSVISRTSSTLVSGSDTRWPAGTLIRALLETAAGDETTGAQQGITVQVFYKPSGSYGA